MNTQKLPEELALDLTARSTAKYQIAAVIFDKHGIISWGWNHYPENNGTSTHAEDHAITRANPKRRTGATIVVAGRKNGSGKMLLAKPCPDCQNLILRVGITKIIYSDPTNSNSWNTLKSTFI